MPSQEVMNEARKLYCEANELRRGKDHIKPNYVLAISKYVDARDKYNGILAELTNDNRDTKDVKSLLEELYYDWHFLYKNRDNSEENDRESVLECLNKAISYYEDIAELNNKKYLEYLEELGIAESKLGNFSSAINTYNKYTELDKNNVNIFWGKADCYYKLGCYDNAISSCEYALELSPDHPDTEFLFGILKHIKAEIEEQSSTDTLYEEARVLYKKAIDHGYTDQALVHHNIALSYQEQKNYTEAIRAYKEVIKIKHESPDSWYFMGVALLEQERFFDAIKAFDNVISMSDEHSWHYCNLARAYKHAGQGKQALEYFKIARNLLTTSDMSSENSKTLLRKTIEAGLTDSFEFDIYMENYNKQNIRLSKVEDAQEAMNVTMESLSRWKKAIDKALKLSGTFAKTVIKEKYYELEAKPELYIYAKTFYWTAMNYFDAYRVTSTDKVVKNIDTEKSLAGQLAVNSLRAITAGTTAAMVAHLAGASLVITGAGAGGAAAVVAIGAAGVSLCGATIPLSVFANSLDKVIDRLYDSAARKKFDEKEKVINKIIISCFTFEEDISLEISRVALKAVQHRSEYLLNPSTDNSKSAFPEFLSQCTGLLEILTGEFPNFIREFTNDNDRIKNTTVLDSANNSGATENLIVDAALWKTDPEEAIVSAAAALAIGDVAIFMNHLFTKGDKKESTQDKPLHDQVPDILNQIPDVLGKYELVDLQGQETTCSFSSCEVM